MLNIIKSFCRVRQFPTDLAFLIGVEESSLLYYLIQTYGSLKFDGNYPKIWKVDTLSKLQGRSLVTMIADNVFIINYTKLDQILCPSDLHIAVIPTFHDERFVGLCEKWHQILKEKNRTKTLKEIYLLFKGKTLEESIEALSNSINNRWVGLHFNESSKDNKTDRSGGKPGITRGGGEYNKGDGKEYNTTKRIGEF